MSDEPDLEQVRAALDSLPVLPPGALTREDWPVAACDSEHPDRPGLHCRNDQGKCYTDHRATVIVDYQASHVIWPNTSPDPLPPEAQPKPKKGRAKASGAAEQMAERTKAQRAGTAGDASEVWREPPIVGHDDPSNSHVAAAQIEPSRGTKRAEVLNYLRVRLNDWVDAPELATGEVGGFGGTRRVRELRQMGWNIETRQKPGALNTWQHRLVDAPAPVVE